VLSHRFTLTHRLMYSFSFSLSLSLTHTHTHTHIAGEASWEDESGDDKEPVDSDDSDAVYKSDNPHG